MSPGKPCRRRLGRLGETWVAETANRVRHGLLTVLLFFLAQLLIGGLSFLTETEGFNFPAPIVGMAAVFLVMLFTRWIIGSRVDSLYARYLKVPTDLLNKHMSIGFTVPLMMISKGPMATPQQIGLIVCCFIVTGILNCVLVYYLALAIQTLIRSKKHRKHTSNDVENAVQKGGIAVKTCYPNKFASAADQSSNTLSDTSSLADTPATPEPKSTTSGSLSATRTKLSHFLRSNLLLLLAILSALLIGLPLALTTPHRPSAFETTLFFLFWLLTLDAQSAIRTIPFLSHTPRLRALLATSLNPVLCTALLMTAYLWAKTAALHVSIDDTLLAFNTTQTLADLFAKPLVGDHALGAGDVAASVLNAGIVSWGLKLFECRSQLLSRAGITVLLVACLVAPVGVIVWPLLAWVIGLRPAARALTFVARSVTLALAGPVMEAVNGEVGLNAAMVVFNGIIFQMVMGLRDGQADSREPDSPVGGQESVDQGVTLVEGGEKLHDDEATVATGVAVGMNANAMGTAYLYQQGSRAAPYSVLSMTLFGVITVVLASIEPLVIWLMNIMAR